MKKARQELARPVAGVTPARGWRTGALGLKPPEPALAARWVRRVCDLKPTLAIVLGSGFVEALADVRVSARIPFGDIPGFPEPTVPGHAGELVFGCLAQVPLLALRGRVHFYEGHAMAAVTFPVRVLAELGIRDLLLTNAAGGIGRRLRPGDFMRLTDHINMMGVNPLRDNAAPGRELFVDLTRTYDDTLSALLRRAATRAKVRMHAGVYLAVSGPSYETPAEIRAWARLGADAVGMSTVPEAVVARQCGMAVAGLSCITNLAAGRGPTAVSHAEVLRTGDRVKQQAARLLKAFCELYAQHRPETAD